MVLVLVVPARREIPVYRGSVARSIRLLCKVTILIYALKIIITVNHNYFHW